MSARITRKIKRPLSLLMTVAFFVMMTLSGEGEEPSPADAYVSAGLGDARILVPFLADDSVSASICGLIYNGLTKLDKDLNVVPDLARSWEISDDGLAITFRLNKNVYWHDGKPFTAEDVKFTYETILDPASACPYVSSYSNIKHIYVEDPYTMTFTYDRPYAPALIKFGMGIIPKHVFEGAGDIRKSGFARNPIGTGPYRFSRWEASELIILEANRDYFEHAPGIGYYVYRIIPDQSVQFLELVSGGLDAMELSPYQHLYRTETREFAERVKKYRYLSQSYTYLAYNLRDPVFGDARVRKALSYAINKKEIIDAALLGLGEECTGPLFKGSPFYNSEVEGYPCDRDKARALLKESGWADTDGDGMLDKNGEKFHVIIATNQGNQSREDTATIIQKQWREVGVDAEIQVVAWAAFLDQFIGKKKFQAVIMGWTTPADPDLYPVWHSDAISEAGLNFMSYSNREVDALIEKGREEFSPAERASIYKKIHEIISDDAPYTFLFFPYALPAVNKRFRGIRAEPAGIGYNFIDWYVPRDEVKYKF
jgi:peptide/nickel transport system substrate-binding protein